MIHGVINEIVPLGFASQGQATLHEMKVKKRHTARLSFGGSAINSGAG